MPPILVWNSFNDETAPGIGYPEYPVEFPNITCPYKCTCKINSWPQNRRKDQNYMMYTVECPVETLKYYDKKFLTNTFFNSSATYRLDSDVYMPHDALTKITPKTPKEYIWDQKERIDESKQCYMDFEKNFQNRGPQFIFETAIN
uniref:Fucosyltransferase N-terminal domain-containing protein n=1 Tax=Meloidogyne floridensis TaxID=298350 RepID=A0A915NZB0_9BILA